MIFGCITKLTKFIIYGILSLFLLYFFFFIPVGYSLKTPFEHFISWCNCVNKKQNAAVVDRNEQSKNKQKKVEKNEDKTIIINKRLTQ